MASTRPPWTGVCLVGWNGLPGDLIRLVLEYVENERGLRWKQRQTLRLVCKRWHQAIPPIAAPPPFPRIKTYLRRLPVDLYSKGRVCWVCLERQEKWHSYFFPYAQGRYAVFCIHHIPPPHIRQNYLLLWEHTHRAHGEWMLVEGVGRMYQNAGTCEEWWHEWCETADRYECDPAPRRPFNIHKRPRIR